MFILTLSGKNQEGAYSVTNSEGNQILYIFEQEDDALRFSMMLEDKDCLLYTSPSPRDNKASRMPSSA